MIAVIADDFSGAAELAGLALRHGLTAEVQTVFSADTAADVVCVDTDTRLLAAGPAAEIAGAVARRVASARPAWIFKKCDSVLRGHVAAEARAVAAAAGLPRVVILAANPSRGRVVHGGRYFVAGVPLPETEWRLDPAYPRRTAEVRDLLGGDAAGCVIPDAVSVEDLAREAAAIDGATLPVGAADFFSALLRHRVPASVAADPEPRPVETGARLLVCGSSAAWPQRRRQAEAAGVAVFSRPCDLTKVLATLEKSGAAQIGIGDAMGEPAALLAELAHHAAVVVRAAGVRRIFLEGGATAVAVVRALGWTRFVARTAAPAGVGALSPAGRAEPLLFVKPGSYDWPAGTWPR